MNQCFINEPSLPDVPNYILGRIMRSNMLYILNSTSPSATPVYGLVDQTVKVECTTSARFICAVKNWL